MYDDDPTDLHALEQAIRASAARPRADLRRRVLAAVDAELARPARAWWHVPAAAAATLLLGLNLAYLAAQSSFTPLPLPQWSAEPPAEPAGLEDLLLVRLEQQRHARLARLAWPMPPWPALTTGPGTSSRANR